MHTLHALAQAAVPAAPTSVTQVLLDHGVLGVCVVVMASVIVYLWRDAKADRASAAEELKKRDDALAALNNQRVAEITALQQKRVEDAQATAAQLLDMSNRCVAVLTSVTSAMDAQREALGEINTTLLSRR